MSVRSCVDAFVPNQAYNCVYTYLHICTYTRTCTSIRSHDGSSCCPISSSAEGAILLFSASASYILRYCARVRAHRPSPHPPRSSTHLVPCRQCQPKRFSLLDRRLPGSAGGPLLQCDAADKAQGAQHHASRADRSAQCRVCGLRSLYHRRLRAELHTELVADRRSAARLGEAQRDMAGESTQRCATSASAPTPASATSTRISRMCRERLPP